VCIYCVLFYVKIGNIKLTLERNSLEFVSGWAAKVTDYERVCPVCRCYVIAMLCAITCLLSSLKVA